MTCILPSAIADDCPICRAAASLRLVYQFENDPHYVVGCTECSVQTIVPHPAKEEIIEFYLGYLTTRTPDEQMPFLVERNLELFEQLWLQWRLPLDFPATRYMEVGFGNGASILAAARLGMETYGYDLNRDNVLDVSRRAKSLGLTVQLYYGDIGEALARGDTFDFIRASQVIEHMIDPVGFVTGAFDLLSDRGYLYIECPNNLALFLKLKNRLRRKFGRMNFYNSLEIGEHLWGFSQRSMTMFMRVCGYDVVFCKDYPMRHRYFQPETLLWYPSVLSGLKDWIFHRQTAKSQCGVPPSYPVLKSLIAAFDVLASLTLSGGMGLAMLARPARLAKARSPEAFLPPARKRVAGKS